MRITSCAIFSNVVLLLVLKVRFQTGNFDLNFDTYPNHREKEEPLVVFFYCTFIFHLCYCLSFFQQFYILFINFLSLSVLSIISLLSYLISAIFFYQTNYFFIQSFFSQFYFIFFFLFVFREESNCLFYFYSSFSLLFLMNFWKFILFSYIFNLFFVVFV